MPQLHFERPIVCMSEEVLGSNVVFVSYKDDSKFIVRIVLCLFNPLVEVVK